MHYKFNSRKSQLYLRFGGTTSCTFHAMAGVDLDTINANYPDNLIKERLKLALFENCPDNAISIERDQNGMIIYTTSDTHSSIYRGCILRWVVES
jgi:hypothetical protein